MKIKVLKKAYYNSQVVKEGMVIDFDGDSIPSWATLVDGIECIAVGVAQQHNLPEQNFSSRNGNEFLQNSRSRSKKEKKLKNKKTDAYIFSGSLSKKEYLEMLIDKAIEYEILIDNFDKLSIDEQIKEFEKELKAKGITLTEESEV